MGDELVNAAKNVKNMVAAPFKAMVGVANTVGDALGVGQGPVTPPGPVRYNRDGSPPTVAPEIEVRQTPTGAIQKKPFPE